MTEMNPAVRLQHGMERLEAAQLERLQLRETARQRAVNLLFLIFLIIVLDGIPRKYLLPGLQRPLVFLRDPVVFYLYFHALRYGFIRKSGFLAAWIALLLLTCFVVVPQSLNNGESIIFVLYGLRQYFALIPLPFVIASVFRQEDLPRFYRLNMIIMMAMAPMMALQALSPQGAWINTGGSGGVSAFDSNISLGDYIRAPGFFSTSQPNTVFLPLVGAILLLVWMMPKRERPCSSLFFGAAAFALTVGQAVSGSRASVAGLGLVMIAAGVSSLLMVGNQAAARAIGAAIAFMVLAVVTSVVLFPNQYDAFRDRWESQDQAAGGSDLLQRAFHDLFEFTDVVPNTPAEGFGLGSASNAATIVGAEQDFHIRVGNAETDWSRHIVDLGPFIGILYIVFRIALTLRLGMTGLRGMARSGDARPWMIFAAAAYTIFNGTIAGQTTLNGLAWFLVGLILIPAARRRETQ